MNLKENERYLRANLLGPGPRLIKYEFTGPLSHKDCYKKPSVRYTAFILTYLESKHAINTLPVTGLLFTGEPASTTVLCYKNNSLTHHFLRHPLCCSWTTGNYLLPSPHTQNQQIQRAKSVR